MLDGKEMYHFFSLMYLLLYPNSIFLSENLFLTGLARHMMTRDHVHLSPLAIIYFPLKSAELEPFFVLGNRHDLSNARVFQLFFPKKEGNSIFLWDKKNINLTLPWNYQKYPCGRRTFLIAI